MNKVYYKAIRIFTIMLLTLSTMFAQHFELSINLPQGIIYQNTLGYFQGGVELSAHYSIPAKNFTSSFGIDARTVQWGSQVSVSSRLSKTIVKNFEIEAELQNGLALFNKKPLYVYSVGLTGRYFIIKSEKTALGIYVGGRFTQCPAYSRYGSIDHIFEIPIGVFISF